MTQAAPEDYIVVDPWWYGVTFFRYYHGSTPWTTLPPIADPDLHRFDEIKVRMQEEHPMEPLIEQMLKTLQTGHRVWVVGELKVAPTAPPEIKPAPNGPKGWVEDPYLYVWRMQAGSAIALHALKASALPKLTADRVNPNEDVAIHVFSGWKPSVTAP